MERRRRADAVDEQAKVSEQRVRDLLWDAQLRDEAAAGHAAVAAGGDDGAFRQQRQLDQAMTEADRARSGKDREAFRKILSQIRVAREAAAQDRDDDARDCRSSHTDRQDASHDRQAAAAAAAIRHLPVLLLRPRWERIARAWISMARRS